MRLNHEQGLLMYEYDAFIVYSSVDEDRLWVHYKLVDQLEKVYGFKLCIHQRDFLGGNNIIDNVEDAINTSRKVVLIISGNFVDSHWCCEEVNMAASIDMGKFVLVMFKDIFLRNVDVPTMVRHLLETRTYIEWNENEVAQQLFWRKMRRALLS